MSQTREKSRLLLHPRIARFKIAYRYDIYVPIDDIEEIGSWRAAIHLPSEHSRPGSSSRKTYWTFTLDEEDDGVFFHVNAIGWHDTDRSWEGIQALRNLQSDILARVEQLLEIWRRGQASQLATALNFAAPMVTVQVPRRTGEALPTSATAEQAVHNAIDSNFPHQVDVEDRRRAIGVELGKPGYLLVTSRSDEFALDGAQAYLLPEPSHRPHLVKPRPIWAWGSALIAIGSVGLSFCPLTTFTLIAMGLFAALVSSATCAVAPRFSARSSHTLIGMSAAIALILFACVYGAVALIDPGTFQVGTGSPKELREPLLLSLGLLTTSGLLDFGVHGWLRSIAYLEMLLVAAFAGGAVVVAARRASDLIGDAVRQIQRDRGGG